MFFKITFHCENLILRVIYISTDHDRHSALMDAALCCRYQGLPVEGNPQMFEQFISQHKCNYFCGLLGLRSLKVLESLTTPTRSKGSRSPLLQRKMTASPSSPQNSRKAAGSPRLSRKVEQDGCKTPAQQKAAEPPKSDSLDIK